MTKKEILENYRGYGETGYVLKAMDEYARQEALAFAELAFAEWISINGWYFNKKKRYSNRNESSDNLIEVLSATKSTEELYTLYLNQSL